MNKKQDHEGLGGKSKGDNSSLPLTEVEGVRSPNSLVTGAGEGFMKTIYSNLAIILEGD